MKYKKPYLMYPSYVPNMHIADFPTSKRATDVYIFSYGRKVPFQSENPDYTAPLQETKNYDLVYQSLVQPEIFLKYDFLPTNKPALVVNKKIINILSEICPEDIQIFPATIVSEKPKKLTFENHDFWVLNLTKTVNVIDETNSIYQQLENTPLKIPKKLTFVENSMNNCHIGRQFNYTPHVIVSPELAAIFKKEKVTGVKFL